MEKKSNTKEVIIENAIKLFYELGYEETTLRKIAAESGFSHVALFSYFKTKGELAAILIDRYLKSLVQITRDFILNNKLYSDNYIYHYLFYWGIHYKILVADKKLSKFYFEFYKNANIEFVGATSNYGKFVFIELFNFKYQKTEIDMFLDFTTISNIDVTLAHLCFDNKITISKAVKYLLNFLNVMEYFYENISNEEIDDFINTNIETLNLDQFDIYQDFLQ
ncbi:MAG: TetR/AcrR family transcriptional regulator [Eubacteriaceae bacterium]